MDEPFYLGERKWGGRKESGLGRENAEEGVEAYTELKAVTIKL